MRATRVTKRDTKEVHELSFDGFHCNNFDRGKTLYRDMDRKRLQKGIRILKKIIKRQIKHDAIEVIRVRWLLL